MPSTQLVTRFARCRVRVVSCSYYHSIVATGDPAAGDVTYETYSFGRNDFGQLGHNDTTEKKFPHPITQLKGQRVVSLACGQYHSCVVTAEGRLMACGKNDYGQVGVESSDSVKRLIAVGGGLEGEIVSEVRCGYYHTLALTTHGPYSFGRNDYGQLGHSPTPRLPTPTPIPNLNSTITRIAAGCYHSVFAEAGGRVWVCGRNNHGQLGVGDCMERHEVTHIDTFVGKYISHIAAGFYHTIILTGADENVTNLSSQDSQSFSSQKVLSMPCMRWNDLALDPLSAMSPVIPAKNANNNENSTLDAALEDESRQSSPRPPFYDEAPISNASLAAPRNAPLSFPEEEDGKSLYSLTSTTPLPFDDQTLGTLGTHPTNAGQTNQDILESAHGSSLFEHDGSCRQDKAALFLLAHMERLSSSLIPSNEDFPVVGLSASTPELNATFNNLVSYNTSKELYCVDVHPSTFHLLHSLIQSLHSPLFSCTLLLEENRSYLILACLRILKANLSRLLMTKDVVGHIRLAILEVQKKGSANEDAEKHHDVLANETIMPAHLLPLPFTTAAAPKSTSSFSPSFLHDSNEATFQSTIDEYVSALVALHQVLILITEAPSYFNETAASVQSEAASTLILGLELFYPTQDDQVKLLTNLFACPLPRDGDRDSLTGDQMSAIEEDSQLRDALLTGLTASRCFLLDPLLERLSDDDIVCYLIPNPENFTIGVDDAVLTPTIPSTSNLNTVMKLLVKQQNLNSEFEDPGSAFHSQPCADEDSTDGSSNQHLQRAKNHRKLISKLILALFKHAMHWAASEKQGSRGDFTTVQGGPQQGAGPQAFLEDSLKGMCDQTTTVGSASLLEFASLALLHAIEFMTKMINSSR